MDRYHLIDMDSFFHSWKKEQTNYGYRLVCPEEIGSGHIEFFGDTESVYIAHTNYTVNFPFIIKNQQQDPIVALTYVSPPKAEYYQKKIEYSQNMAPSQSLECGIHFHASLVPKLFFSRINEPIHFQSIVFQMEYPFLVKLKEKTSLFIISAKALFIMTNRRQRKKKHKVKRSVLFMPSSVF